MLRKLFVLLAVAAFVGLGIDDLVHGRWSTGLAAICLATANALLLL